MQAQALNANTVKLLPPEIWRWLLVLQLSCFLCVLTADKALGQYRFDNWTTNNGLPQNSVLAITQTRDGYLWLTTYNGLVRFDGVHFTVFDRNNSPGLAANSCTMLQEDAAGALWIGLVDGGAARYYNGTFTSFTTAQGLPRGAVRQFQSGESGSVLITTGTGMVWWRNGRFEPEPNSDNEFRIHLGRSGTRWSLDKNGLHSRRGNQSKHYTLPFVPERSHNNILYEDQRGHLWLMLQGKGVLKVSEDVIIDYTQRVGLNDAHTVQAILEDTDGSFWFGTENSGLMHFRDEPGGKPIRYTTSDGLSSNTINALYRDREGNLWIGAAGGGLNRMAQGFISGYSTLQGLGGNITHAVLADRANNVWVATHVGLSKITNGVVTNYSAADGLPLTGLQALHEDRAGRLWIGASSGLCSFKDGVFSNVTHNLNVWAILEDRQGALWVGTHFGLFKFKDGVKTDYFTRDGLPSDTVKSVYEDRQGTLWFGTEGGLVKLQDDRLTVFTTKDGLPSNRVWSIYEDAESTLWLGTFDGGLSRFKDGRFTNYTTAQGLANNTVFQILEDAHGNFWMSCFRGLFSVPKQQLNDFADGKLRLLNCTSYGKADGMLNSDGNGGRQPSGVKTADGRLWFTTLGGVAVVNPNGATSNPLPPSVQIEEVKIDNAVTQAGAEIRVLPEQANLEIRYTALSFIKPDQLRFRYKLIGQDHDWIEAGGRRVANYSYLRPGTYSFQVLAANSDGVWNNQGAQLRVVVLPAFYQTLWFRALALLAFGGLAFTAYRWRILQLRSEQQRQVEFSRRLIEAHESERARLAAELHDSLGQDLLVIKNWAMVGLTTTEAANEAREMLTEIADATTHAIEDCREISHNLRPHQLDFIGLTEALRAMINKVANSSGLHIEAHLDDLTGALPGEAEINLYRIVQESLNNIVKHAHAKQVKLDVRKETATDNGHAVQTIVRIQDDGRGFDLTALSNGKRGLGLSSITERTRMLDGEVVIDSSPGRGTIITVILNSQ